MNRRFSTSVAMTALVAALAGPVAMLPLAAAAQQAPAPGPAMGGQEAGGPPGADRGMGAGPAEDWPDADRDRDRDQARDTAGGRAGDRGEDRAGERTGDHAEAPPRVPGPETLPRLLLDLGMRPGEARPTRHGTLLEGEMPDGTRIEAWVDDEGELRGLRSDGEGPLPPPVVERLVPRTVLDQPILSELGRLEAVFSGERGVMLVGRDAQGNKVRAAFAPDGTLMRFGRGEADGRGMGGRMGPGDRNGDDRDHTRPHDRDRDHDRDGRWHDGDRRGDEDGWRGDRDRDGDPDGNGGWRGDRDAGPMGGPDHPGPSHPGPEGRDGRGDWPGPGGDRGAHDRGGRDGDAPRAGDAGGPARDRDRIRAALDEAGYTDVGRILRQGPVGVAQATNPEGERVLVEIGPDGEIVRELNR